MITELKPMFVDTIPEIIEPGILYVSEKYETSIHLCACGKCNQKTVLPFSDSNKHWVMTKNDNKITFRPSVGNFNFPCRSHYHITNNIVEPCSDWKP